MGLVGLSLFSQASASLARSPLASEPSSNPRVLGLFYDAKAALGADELQRALIDMKLAASAEPKNTFVLTELGVVLNRMGAYRDAKTVLERARSLGAPDDLVLGPWLDAKLALGENQEVLDLFMDPGPANHSDRAATILRARASVFQALGDADGATSLINRSLAIRTDLVGLMTAARIAFWQHAWSRAGDLADRALKISPGNTDVLIFKIEVAVQSGDKAKALEMAEQLVADKPTNQNARLERVKIFLELGKTDLAKPEVDRILARAPHTVNAIYYRAIILAMHSNLAGAWAVAQTLPAEFRLSDTEIAINVANMAAGAGFLESGATILNAAVLKNQHLLSARLLLAEFRLRQKSPQYALNVLAPVEDSKDPRVAILYAKTYIMAHRWADAQRSIERAIELRGGEALKVLGKDVALRSLKEWLKRHPGDLLARRQYAVLLLWFGDFANAKTQYEQLVRDHPDDAFALNNLSWLVVKDDPVRSLKLAQRAVKQVPTSPDFLDTLGCMQLNQSDRKGALSSLQQAHRLKPMDAEISYHLALALDANGSRAAAKAVLSLAVAQAGFSDIENARRLLTSWH